jgi:glycosyltransferase involved in cell wall biosynthesis
MSEFPLNGRKITFVIEKLAQRSGGAERVLIEVANALARRGYMIEILSHEFRGRPPFFPLEFGVVHTNLRGLPKSRTKLCRAIDKVRNKLHQFSNAPYPLSRLLWHSKNDGFKMRLQRHIDATCPDAVVAFMPPAIKALSRAQGKHRPIKFASMHNAPEQDFENPVRWDPSPYDRKRRLELMYGIDKIGILLPEYAEWYPSKLREKTIVIPNFVVPVLKEVRQQAKRTKTLLCVGRLANVKRHEMSLRVFKKLSEEFPDWKIKIYGVGPNEEALKNQIIELGLEKRAYLMGHTNAIAKEYLSAAALCHPAEFEGFPLAVTEALSCELPVVGFSDCSGLNHLVKNGKNGILADPGNGSVSARENALFVALQKIMKNERERLRLGAQGPGTMAQYEPEKIVTLWEESLFERGVSDVSTCGTLT